MENIIKRFCGLAARYRCKAALLRFPVQQEAIAVACSTQHSSGAPVLLCKALPRLSISSLPQYMAEDPLGGLLFAAPI